ncbi:MAG: S26 family signal peptidase [Flavobacteriaceae bacterium]
MSLTLEEASILRKISGIDSVNRSINTIKISNETFFPNKITYNWNEDNFGPIVIPKKGMKVELNRKNISLYKKIISEYEGNKLEINPSQIKVNDIHVEQYTFKKDYYWMMGDNRHKSEDSRFWGFCSR